MNSLLYGNGVTIQFGGRDYLNDKIIKRAINNVNTKNFHPDLYPREIKDWLLYLFQTVPHIVKGEYDECANTTDMKKSLIYFKERYKNINYKIKVHNIGFEDYFLVHFLVCSKERIVNPDKYIATQSLRRIFLDSIYNNGKIQKIHTNYPEKFKQFLKDFDYIFTTNYDWNVQQAIGKHVEYIHGAFHLVDEIYDPNSFRNKLSDSPIKEIELIEGYDHLYSNALTSYSGESKKFTLDMGIDSNNAIEKFVNGLKEKPEIWEEVNTWKHSNNQTVRNLYESIVLKTEDESLTFKENKTLYDLAEIEGELSILGLSPYNDNHIFETILNNKELFKVNFYYYGNEERDSVKEIFKNKEIEFINVSELWSRLD